MTNNGSGQMYGKQSGLEDLYKALKRDVPDASIQRIAMGLTRKGYSTDALVGKVSTNVGPRFAARLKKIMSVQHGPDLSNVPRSSRTGRFRVSRRALFMRRIREVFYHLGRFIEDPFGRKRRRPAR